MKYLFLINSFSLRDKVKEFVKKIEIVCEQRKLEYVIEINSEKVSTEKILDKYKNEKCIIMAIGGDGIINRVVNCIDNTNNVLGFIPLGTGNDFYKTNRDDFPKGINKMDLVKINDKYFINITCFGIDVDIANNREIIHSKIIPKKQRYNIGLLYHFFRYKARRLMIEIEDKIFEDTYTTVVLCNAKYYGNGYKIGSNSSLTDGLVDVYMFKKMNIVKMASLILGMNKGKHEKLDKLVKISTSKLKIISDKEITCNMDGEELTAKKFNVEVIPLGIEVYYDQDLINDFVY